MPVPQPPGGGAEPDGKAPGPSSLGPANKPATHKSMEQQPKTEASAGKATKAGYPWHYPFKGITVTVLKEVKPGKLSYRVRWNLADGHEDKTFPTSGKAKDYARHKAIDLANNWLPSKEELAQLRQKSCLFDRCAQLLEPFQWDPIRAVYAMGQLLDNMGPDGVGKYIAVYGPKLAKVIPHTAAEALRKYLAHLDERNEVSPRHIQNIKPCLNGFAEEFDGECLHTIPCGQIQDWLLDREIKGTTLDKWIYALRRMFGFAQRFLKALPQGIPTEAELVQRVKSESAEPEVFDLPDLERVARALPDKETILALCLVLFGHVRPNEAVQLGAEHFRPGPDGATPAEIVVPRTVAKGRKGQRRARTIPIRPNLAEILKVTLPAQGPLFQSKDVFARIRRVARAIGVDWKHNALRHCCDSYAVAAGTPKAKVVKWSGHTQPVLDEHYLVPVVPAEAKKYWKLTFDCQRIARLPAFQKSKLEPPATKPAEQQPATPNDQPGQLHLFDPAELDREVAA